MPHLLLVMNDKIVQHDSPSPRQNKSVGLLDRVPGQDSNTLGNKTYGWGGDEGHPGGGMGAQRPGLKHTPLHPGVGFSEADGMKSFPEVLTFHNRCLNPPEYQRCVFRAQRQAQAHPD